MPCEIMNFGFIPRLIAFEAMKFCVIPKRTEINSEKKDNSCGFGQGRKWYIERLEIINDRPEYDSICRHSIFEPQLH